MELIRITKLQSNKNFIKLDEVEHTKFLIFTIITSRHRGWIVKYNFLAKKSGTGGVLTE